MKTIKQSLEENIKLLETNLVKNHIRACHDTFNELSAIKGYDPMPKKVLAEYSVYLILKNSKVKFYKKVFNFIRCQFLKVKILKNISICKKKTFGDGDYLIQNVFKLIKASI